MPESHTIVVRDAVVHVTSSRTVRGDVVTTDGMLSRVGPAQRPDPPGALVLDAPGASVVPLLVDGAIRARGDDARDRDELAPGRPAIFAVIRGAVRASRIGEMLMVDPRDMLAVVLEDRLVAWDGAVADSDDPGPAWTGAWTDGRRGMTQFLTAHGRYSETRGGRADAYTGRFWAHRDRIAYLDDTGFWAFGEQVDGILHHGGFVLRRA
ncbi:Atu4866 domain-containing protein [Microbacterium betulae]|uniref:Atu4866 domain-containing protein n=1 Tax=Microbacterium betulae TaxID=2981139 RepID=A0AA97I3P0_9MICO|nr:Atu4866 domain-containing protein [Microbacterium sp. AB]WOF21661.1 Atu4866 domain-containing protein [Microbacterium sp. AB]